MTNLTSVTFREEITLDDLTAVLARLGGEHGCPACGLNGFDVHFGLDPEARYATLRDEFRQIAAVRVLPEVELDVAAYGRMG